MNLELDWDHLLELAKSGEIKHVLCDIFDTAITRKMVTYETFLVSKYGFWGRSLYSIDRIIRFISKKLTKQDISKNFIGRLYLSLIKTILIEDLKDTQIRTTVINFLEELQNFSVEIIFVSNTDCAAKDFRNQFPSTVFQHTKIYTSSDVGVYKSNGLFVKVIEQEHLDSEMICIIGDSGTEDIEIATLLGVKNIKVDSYFDSLACLLNSKQINGLAKNPSTKDFLVSFGNWFNSSIAPTNWESVGFIYSYALSSFIADQIACRMINEKESEIIFLSREGYMPWRIVSSLPQEIIKTHYLYVSRRLVQSKEGRAYVFQQIANFRLTGIHSAIFDVGWRGKSVKQVRSILNMDGPNYFLAIWPWRRSVVKSTSLFANKRNFRRMIALRGCPEIYEYVLTAPHKSAISQTVIAQSLDSIEIQMCKGFESALKMNLRAFDHSNLYQLFGGLIRRPSKKQALFFGSVMHSTTGEASRTLIDPVGLLWIKGALRAGEVRKFDLIKEFARRIVSVVKQLRHESTFE